MTTKLNFNANQLWLFLAISLCNIAMLSFRLIYWEGHTAAVIPANQTYKGYTYLFLVWNLFLAWIPYLISLALLQFSTKSKKIGLAPFLLIIWLLFLPNAPYIITDLIHLKARPPIPIWLDLLLIFSFALTGLMLGMSSIFQVESWLQQYYSKWLSRLFPWIIFPLSSLGIYLGRFLRWNSWELFTQPQTMLLDFLQLLSAPAFYKEMTFIIIPLTLIQLFLYAYLKLGNSYRSSISNIN